MCFLAFAVDIGVGFAFALALTLALAFAVAIALVFIFQQYNSVSPADSLLFHFTSLSLCPSLSRSIPPLCKSISLHSQIVEAVIISEDAEFRMNAFYTYIYIL